MSCLLAVCIAVGVTANSYTELENTYAFNLKVGNEVYGWVSYEDQTTRILGQGLSDADVYSAGVGAKYTYKGWVGFIEAGYAVTDSTDNIPIRDEVVYTTLVHNHGVRTIPSKDPQYHDSAHTSYELEDGIVGRLGIGYQYERILVSLAYRYLTVDEKIKLWDDDVVSTTGGWWQETNSRDLSAFEMGISWTF